MSKLFSMMIIAAVGLGTIRIGLLEERDRRQLAKLSLYVLQPCLIIMSFQIELTQERLKGFGLAVIFSALIHFGFIFAAEITDDRLYQLRQSDTSDRKHDAGTGNDFLRQRFSDYVQHTVLDPRSQPDERGRI